MSRITLSPTRIVLATVVVVAFGAGALIALGTIDLGSDTAW